MDLKRHIFLSLFHSIQRMAQALRTAKRSEEDSLV